MERANNIQAFEKAGCGQRVTNKTSHYGIGIETKGRRSKEKIKKN